MANLDYYLQMFTLSLISFDAEITENDLHHIQREL